MNNTMPIESILCGVRYTTDGNWGDRITCRLGKGHDGTHTDGRQQWVTKDQSMTLAEAMAANLVPRQEP
jgi:hypothetical protein